MMLSDEQMRFGDAKYDSLPPKCLNCQFLSLCYGECPRNRFVNQPGTDRKLNYLCEGLTNYFRHVKPYMEFMASELRHERSPMNVMQWAKNNPAE
jgi:uncharacterized protein